jgi:hypothetical protein
MMVIATRNNGDAKDFRDRALDWLKFDEPNKQKTIDAAAKPRTNFVMSK